ncbi:hypothetical protein [Pedobacter sp. UYP1]|uniref:hypothetical protein n=1 Tax=Pedobacter sp. UYP1 TaxID=1756396 RepID=UPI003394CE09
MIAGFIQADAFMKVISELKENCCLNDSEGRKGKAVLFSIWSEISCDLESRLKEKSSFGKLAIVVKMAQNSLTDFSNDIYHLHQQLEPCGNHCRLELRDCLKEIGLLVVKTLEDLFNNYAIHFNLNGILPLWLVYNNKEAIAVHKTIIHKLQVKHLEPELILTLDSYLFGLHNPENNKVKCWSQFHYMQHLVEELVVFIEQLKDWETIKLIKFLIGQNFNPLPFYEFFLEYAVTIVSPDMPYEDQEMEWLVLLKMTDNIRPENKTGFNSEVPTILESISGFIHRELEIISKMKAVMIPFPLEKRGSNFYFSVSITIEELFFLIRVMLAVRFIKVRYKANLYSFVANHIKTDRSNNPSAQYMRNVFSMNKVVPARIVKKVRFWLVAMITYIDTHFTNCLKFWFFGMLTVPYLLEFFDL